MTAERERKEESVQQLERNRRRVDFAHGYSSTVTRLKQTIMNPGPGPGPKSTTKTTQFDRVSMYIPESTLYLAPIKMFTRM
ncbi:hypothetical protein Y032_0005g2437 [Ancylostoma ceylanicum]|uniref:Uncharacterized protein n=1 Tax=Ancylostoma ceylanicum TaxID=53326 RepID=A0A016VRA8_9BILA|nr:hypothetical protein Y032_0005g2437 [Ancylostoma ceylanicum]